MEIRLGPEAQRRACCHGKGFQGRRWPLQGEWVTEVWMVWPCSSPTTSRTEKPRALSSGCWLFLLGGGNDRRVKWWPACLHAPGQTAEIDMKCWCLGTWERKRERWRQGSAFFMPCPLNNQTGCESQMSKHFQGQEDTVQGDKQNHLVRATDLYPNYQLTPTLQVLRNLATQSRLTSYPG